MAQFIKLDTQYLLVVQTVNYNCTKKIIVMLKYLILKTTFIIARIT